MWDTITAISVVYLPAAVTLEIVQTTAVATPAPLLWPRLVKWWEQAKEGGQIFANPRWYFARVFLPEALSWSARENRRATSEAKSAGAAG